MADGVQVEFPDLDHFGRVLRGSGSVIRRRVQTALRQAGKPIGEKAIREGSADLPSHGGLRNRVREARVDIRLEGSGVALSLSDRDRDALGGLDEGRLIHPVFGKRKTWVEQRIRPASFRRALDRQAPALQTKVRDALQRALDDIAREA